MINIKKTLAKYVGFCYYVFCYLAERSLLTIKEVLTMAKCDICNKEIAFGIKVSHSHRRSNRTWKPNVKKVKAIVNGTPCRVNVCTRCLRSGKVTRAI